MNIVCRFVCHGVPAETDGLLFTDVLVPGPQTPLEAMCFIMKLVVKHTHAHIPKIRKLRFSLLKLRTYTIIKYGQMR